MSRVSCRSSTEKAIATFAPRDAMGLPPKKVLRTLSEVLDFVRDDFRRLRRQGQESEEIASSCRVRSESAFEASKGVFVLQHAHGNYPILDYVCPKCDLGGDQGVPDWYVSPTGRDESADE